MWQSGQAHTCASFKASSRKSPHEPRQFLFHAPSASTDCDPAAKLGAANEFSIAPSREADGYTGHINRIQRMSLSLKIDMALPKPLDQLLLARSRHDETVEFWRNADLTTQARVGLNGVDELEHTLFHRVRLANVRNPLRFDEDVAATVHPAAIQFVGAIGGGDIAPLPASSRPFSRIRCHSFGQRRSGNCVQVRAVPPDSISATCSSAFMLGGAKSECRVHADMCRLIAKLLSARSQDSLRSWTASGQVS